MPTSKPRIIVTLEPSDKAVLDDLAEAMGTSVASIVRELIKEAVPEFPKIISVIRQAKTSPAAAFEQMSDYLAGIQYQTAQAQLELIEKKATHRRGGRLK